MRENGVSRPGEARGPLLDFRTWEIGLPARFTSRSFLNRRRYMIWVRSLMLLFPRERTSRPVSVSRPSIDSIRLL